MNYTLFTSPYSQSQFLHFLHHDFLPDDFEPIEQPVNFASKPTYTQQATRLGVCRSLDLVVYEIRHSGKDDPRVGLSKEAFRMLSEEWQSRALVLFVPENNPNNYRFSLIEIKLEGEESAAKVSRRYSNPRRYSFALGVGTKARTPYDYLVRKGRVRDFDDLQKRFSVEVLTKEFYAELSQWYAFALKVVRFPGEPVGEEAIVEHESKNLIRLLTRILFVWFIKQKNLIPAEFFDKQYLTDHILVDFDPDQQIGLDNEKSLESKYYKAILQNLFFATLNCPIATKIKADSRARGFRKNERYGHDGRGGASIHPPKKIFSLPCCTCRKSLYLCTPKQWETSSVKEVLKASEQIA